ncbi:MAG: hypothetical protein R2742_12305 [Micropruina glycogenica]
MLNDAVQGVHNVCTLGRDLVLKTPPIHCAPEHIAGHPGAPPKSVGVLRSVVAGPNGLGSTPPHGIHLQRSHLVGQFGGRGRVLGRRAHHVDARAVFGHEGVDARYLMIRVHSSTVAPRAVGYHLS